MYKSSPFTFIFIYIFPVVLLIISVPSIYISWNHGNANAIASSKALLVTSIWVWLFLIQMPFRLKYVETLNSQLLVKSFGRTVYINYRDILWITKYDITCPWFVTIKYKDPETGVSKKISFIPSKTDQRFFSDDLMTAYIKNAIKASNPHQSEETPSKLKNVLLLIVLSIPVAILNIYLLQV